MSGTFNAYRIIGKTTCALATKAPAPTGATVASPRTICCR
jgi:hypothetical protein